MSARVSPWLLVFLAAASPAFFALATGNIWEDFFITYRCSLYLLHGDGLVYEAGRRLHVFTSPLGTLLPAGLATFLRSEDPLVVLAAFRLLAYVALASGWFLVAGNAGISCSSALITRYGGGARGLPFHEHA